MGLNEAPLLFNFEVESSENFTYIPMSVRFNLDRFGLRISLDQWQSLPLEDRKLLARFPVDEDAQIEPNFDHALFEMLRTHANVEPEWFTPEDSPAWRRTDSVPDGVARQAQLAGLTSPSVERWAAAGAVQALCAGQALAQTGGQPRLRPGDEGVWRGGVG